MPEESEIRPREPADLPACVAALREVHERDGYPQRWPLDPHSFLTPAGLTAAWVADGCGAVRGHVTLIAQRPDALLLSRLFVVPAARGTGLARTLLHVAMARAAGSGAGLQLEVVDDAAPAIRLYEGAGWQLVERRPASWVGPSGRPTVRIYAVPHAGTTTAG